jgi:hypothetical protein
MAGQDGRALAGRRILVVEDVFDQAARPTTRWTKVRWAGTVRTCPLASIAMASTRLDAVTGVRRS